MFEGEFIGGNEENLDKKKEEMASRIVFRDWIDKINEGNCVDLDKKSDCAIIAAALCDSGLNNVDNLLPGQIERVKKQYKDLQNIDFLTEKDWERLTVFELFDVETFEHCIGTYKIARQKIEENIEIREYILEEGVDLESFYRACLLHDVGKIRIPKFVLHNPIEDDIWAEHIIKSLKDPKDTLVQEKIIEYGDEKLLQDLRDIEDSEEVVNILQEAGLRAVLVVPIKEVLNKDQISKLKNSGISASLSLLEIMRRHEKASYEILHKEGLELEAELAGHHHNYKYNQNKPSDKFKTVSHLNIADKVISLIHLADVQHALKSKRSYSSAQSTIKALVILIGDVKKGLIDDDVAHIWIKSEFDNIEKMNNKEKLDYKESDFQKIKEYLG